MPMLRSWVLPLFLLLVPLLVYSNTIFAEFGLRDDYSILREAREEPGKVLKGCGAQARPLYGLLLENSFRQMQGIPDLALGRLLAALLLGATAASAALIFIHRLKWPAIPATLTGGLLLMLPSAQVIVSWSICWPFALATLLATCAFAAAQRGWADEPRHYAWGWLAGALIMLVAATLIYPPQTLLYLVLMAAAVPAGRGLPWRSRLVDLSRNFILLGAALGLSFAFAEGLFAISVFPASSRIAIEHLWLDKLYWISISPLKDALALFALDDHFGRTDFLQRLSLICTGGALLAGTVLEFRRQGRSAGILWLLSLIVIPLAALSVALIAAERWAPYRTLYSLSGVLLVFAVLGLAAVFERGGHRLRRLLPVALAAAVIATGWTARRQAWTLIAVPQMEELRLVRAGAERIHPTQPQRIFVIRPLEADAHSPIISNDEFGSLSTNSDWTPVEMIKQVLKQRFPGVVNALARSQVSSGWFLPKDQKWDVVIDLKHPLTRTRATATGRPPLTVPSKPPAVLH